MGQRVLKYTPHTFFTTHQHVATTEDPCFGHVYTFQEKGTNKLINVTELDLDCKSNVNKMDIIEKFELRMPPNNILSVY